MTKHLWIALALALLPAALSAQALPRCPDTLTIGECNDFKLKSAQDSLNAVDPHAAEKKELIQKTTGVTTPAEEDASIGDFLSRLATSLVTPGLDDSIDQLGTSFNFPIGSSLSVKLGLTLKKPAVYQPLLDSLPESRREAFKERVEGDFGELDQPIFTAMFNPETKSWGRRYQNHANDFSHVLNELRGRSKQAVADAAGRNRPAFTRKVAAALNNRLEIEECPNTQTPSNLVLSCLNEDYRAELESFLDALMSVRVRQEAWLEAELDRIGFNMLADLVNNQPQLTFSASYDALSSAVGPTGVTVKVGVESGFANMNRLRAACNQTIAAACMSTYLGRNDVKRSLRRGNRLWASFDYTFQGDYAAPYLPSDSAQFALPSAWDFNLSAGYGLYVNPGSDGAQESRMDAMLKYTGRKEDGIREQSQLAFSLNVTQRITDMFAGSFGLVWANKSELIGDDFRKVGARLGLRFKLAEPEQD